MIKWEKIVGLRDVLIHQYFGIDYKTVWDIVKNHVPFLKEQVDRIFKEIETKNEI